MERMETCSKNTEYLVSRIKLGKSVNDGKGYIFTMPSEISITPENGVMVYVDLETGEITTLDLITDKETTKLESNEKRGYVTVQLALPWLADNQNKNYIAGTSEYTCYIHRIVGLTKYILTDGYIDYTCEINHLNGKHSDNRAVNLEMCSSRWNSIHGYFLELIYYLRGTYLGGEYFEVFKDKHGNNYLSHGISYELIRDCYNSSQRFRDLVDECYKNKNSRDKVRKEKVMNPDALAILNRYIKSNPSAKRYIV